MALMRVLITVKTYPTISGKYNELVCTAGFREDGSWVRIYPVPFRKKPYHEQYKKYDWIELDLVKNTRDPRPESFRPKTLDSEIKIISHLDTRNNWAERKKYCLRHVYTDMNALIAEAKDKKICRSLAVFKPTEILDFYAESVDREWSNEQKAALAQGNLFESINDQHFEVVKKLPYKFKFRFKDANGSESNMMIEDWETGQLFWNCLAKHEGNEQKAIEDVRKKYYDNFARTKDLYFFLGTTQKNHFVSHNPFIIIGTFHPKIENQLKLF
jgi:hypothetical protein